MPHLTRRGGAALAVACACLLAALFPVAAEAKGDVAFTISDSRITESSGLATDSGSGIYWTVNDSGAQGVAYGLSPEGKVKGTVTFQADVVDVEAVAFADGRLYLADIGDNKANRDFVTVYTFDQPAAGDQNRQYRSYDFSYPDGPHDAEALLVDPSGRLFLVTKGAKGGIYAAPAQLSRQETNRLTRVGDAPAFVTDGVFLPGGKSIALRGYLAVQVLDARSYQTTARAQLPSQPQGESITVDLDGQHLLVGSEGKNSTVLRVGIPDTMDTIPTAEASAPAQPPEAIVTPRSTTGADDPGQEGQPQYDNESDTEGRSRAGTWAVLGIAAVVALAAGGTVYLIDGLDHRGRIRRRRQK